MFEIDKKEFGNFVAEHRKEKGYTQKELAEHLFISDKAISKWETGVSIPDAALWVPLADILGVTVTELLLCQSVEKASPMNPVQVESLVKKAISFSDENPVEVHKKKRQRAAILFVCVLISCALNLFIYYFEAMSSSLITIDILGIIFGGYFMLFAKETLPTYYDENKISSYSDGFFRMNMPGIQFNNSNWPHMVHVAQIWTMGILVGFPALYGVISLFMPSIWLTYGLYITLALVLGGLFIPMYVVGKKYQ